MSDQIRKELNLKGFDSGMLQYFDVYINACTFSSGKPVTNEKGHKLYKVIDPTNAIFPQGWHNEVKSEPEIIEAIREIE